jgi:AcrR family transcriptional regulator
MAVAGEGPKEAERLSGGLEALLGKLNPGRGMLASEVAAHQRARIHRAMIDVVAERGYSTTRVRDVVGRAGVSTRAFYEQFESKEDCFLRTHEVVVRGAVRRVIGAQVGAHDWRERLRLIFEVFVRELESGPKAARLALFEAYEAGPKALAQARRTERSLQTFIAESLARAPEGIVVPPLIVEGILVGAAWVARSRLLREDGGELSGLGAELTEWALCLAGKPAVSLAVLDRRSALASLKLEPGTELSITGEGDIAESSTGRLPEDDQMIILAAAAKLAAAHGYRHLTVPRIRARAGISRAAFDAQFEGVEDCFLEVLKRRVAKVLTETAHAQASGQSWAGCIYRGIACLCDGIAADPLLVSLCLSDEFDAGSSGSLWRGDLLANVFDLLHEGVPLKHRTSGFVSEASAGGAWGIFHHHVIRSPSQQGPRIAATLSYMALASGAGAAIVVDAIRREQAV